MIWPNSAKAFWPIDVHIGQLKSRLICIITNATDAEDDLRRRLSLINQVDVIQIER